MDFFILLTFLKIKLNNSQLKNYYINKIIRFEFLTNIIIYICIYIYIFIALMQKINLFFSLMF